mmetsp:Transcript_2318/g.7851  ORF Transcript_2318/g.7851 Transcript_2318/m.7851 type:complete len:210 (+) Transcript_2318:837-1466(+)
MALREKAEWRSWTRPSSDAAAWASSKVTSGSSAFPLVPSFLPLEAPFLPLEASLLPLGWFDLCFFVGDSTAFRAAFTVSTGKLTSRSMSFTLPRRAKSIPQNVSRCVCWPRSKGAVCASVVVTRRISGRPSPSAGTIATRSSTWSPLLWKHGMGMPLMSRLARKRTVTRAYMTPLNLSLWDPWFVFLNSAVQRTTDSCKRAAASGWASR